MNVSVKLKSSPLLDRALSLIAEKGLDGLTYRALASSSGLTLGQLTARVGKKGQILNSLMEHSLALQAQVHGSWQQRLGALPVPSPSEFSVIFMAYMRECCGMRRNEAIFLYEMIAEFPRIEKADQFIHTYLAAEKNFWLQFFTQWGLDNPADKASLVSSFYLGDVGYLLNLAHEVEYQIALALNLDFLAQHVFLGGPASADTFGNAFLSTLCSSQEIIGSSIPFEGKRFEVSEAAALLIIERGFLALTHRAVAADLGVTAAAISHYFRTKEELINAGLLAMHAIMHREITAIAHRVGKRGVSQEKPAVSDVLFRTVHSLILAGLRDPDFRPILRRERLERGKSTGKRLGRPEAKITAQVVALIRYGIALAQGLDGLTSENITNVFLSYDFQHDITK